MKTNTGRLLINAVLPDYVNYDDVLASCQSKMLQSLKESIFSRRAVTVRDMSLVSEPHQGLFPGEQRIRYCYEIRVGIADPEETAVGEHTFMEVSADLNTTMLVSGKMFVREVQDLWRRIG